MKGALVKELYAIKNNRLIVLLCFYLILIPLCILLRGSGLIIPLYTLAFVAPLSYASHDDRHGWNDFAKALPYKREQRVGARYLVCGAEMLLPIILQVLLDKILGRSFNIAIVHQSVIHFFISSLALAVILFVCYRFSRGLRRLLAILSAVVFSLILDGGIFDLYAGIRAIYVFEPWFVFVTVAAGVYFIAISYMLSVRSQMPGRERRQKMRKGLSVTVCSLAAVACGCVCILGLHGRLVPEPIYSDVEIITEHDNVFVQRFLHDVRKTSNYQKLSQQEMYSVLKNLADKDLQTKNRDEVVTLVEQAGMKMWHSSGLLSEEFEMMGTSRYGTVFCWYSYDLSVYCGNTAKYVAVTDDSETEFNYDEFRKGISATELIDMLEKKSIPITSFESDYKGETYCSYIAYENLTTKEIKLLMIRFELKNGVLENCIGTWIDNDEEYEDDFSLDLQDAEALKADMFAFAKAFSKKPNIYEPMEDCKAEVVAIGGKLDDDGVFTEYSLDTSDIMIKINDSSAYPDKVMFLGAYAWASGEYTNSNCEESGVMSFCSAFVEGMSDAQVVQLLEQEDVYLTSVVEVADYTYDPPISEKTYTVEFYTGEQLAGDNFTVCVKLSDGKVSETEIRLNDEKYVPGKNRAVAKELLEYLENNTNENMTLPELVAVFEDMNEIEAEGVAAQDDTVLFEVMPWGDDFLFSLTRQIPADEGDEYYQVHMDIVYEYDENKHKDYYFSKWSDVHYGDFFDFVMHSEAYALVEREQHTGVIVSFSET